MRSYRSHTSYETKTVMIKPGYGDTAAALDGPGHDKLQVLIGTACSYLLSMAGANRREKTLTLLTLCTQIAGAPGRPAASPSATGTGSDAERDTSGCKKSLQIK